MKIPLDQRVVVLMTKAETDAIEEYMFTKRIKSRSEAIRRLCNIGLSVIVTDEVESK